LPQVSISAGIDPAAVVLAQGHVYVVNVVFSGNDPLSRDLRVVVSQKQRAIYNRQGMDSLLIQVILRILAGIASLWCFVMAITWFRATKEMQRTGNARRLPFPFPTDFMWLDMVMMAIRRNPRIPPELQEKYERMEFVSIINGNLLRAFSLLIFALLGLLFAIGRLIVR
jgi:hypothetical protein